MHVKTEFLLFVQLGITCFAHNQVRYNYLVRLGGVEPPCVQLTFQLVRSQRVYRRIYLVVQDRIELSTSPLPIYEATNKPL